MRLDKKIFTEFHGNRLTYFSLSLRERPMTGVRRRMSCPKITKITEITAFYVLIYFFSFIEKYKPNLLYIFKKTGNSGDTGDFL